MIATANECRFDEATHKYYRGSVELPSVTTILKAVWPRTDSAPEDKIEHARLRGEWVDGMLTRYLQGEYLEFPTGSAPQEFMDCLEQAIKWWDSNRKGASVECQKRLFGEFEACTPDLIVDGCEIIELKSTWEISKTVPAQLGGQGDLYSGEVNPDIMFIDYKIRTCGVLHVHRRFKKAQFKAIDYAEAWRQWRVVRGFWRLINGRPQ